MVATWNGALFSAATIRQPVSTQSSRRAFGKAVVQRLNLPALRSFIAQRPVE